MNRHVELTWGEQTPEARALPFYHLLPKDYIGLLKWRIYVRERCLKDKQFRATIWYMCSKDIAFFAATFVIFHETRATRERIGRFAPVLDPDQIDILALFAAHGGLYHITVQKTRGVGLSFLCCVYMIWLWLFQPHALNYGMLSKELSSLDERGRPGTLMGKLDCIFNDLPHWVRIDRNGKTILRRVASSKHIFENLQNGNIITGYVPETEELRSDRLYVLIADEAAFLPIETQKFLAAVYGTCDSVVWISTHQGTANLFYQLTNDEESPKLIRVSAWWWNNARCRRGLYKIVGGQIEIFDNDYYLNRPDYFTEYGAFLTKLEPIIGDRWRSPWADDLFMKPKIEPQLVLEELYGISAIASRKLIRADVVRQMAAMSRPPMAKGYIRNEEWVDDPEGDFWLWIAPSRPIGLCCIGVDPALTEHTGAYFAAAGFNFKTGEQVFSYRSRCVTADAFPGIIIDAAAWLAGGGMKPEIAFESQGPAGTIFMHGAERLRYSALAREEGKTKPGYGNTDGGIAILTEFGRAVREGECFPRDTRLLFDADGYEFDEEWKLVFAGRDGHGDLLIASAFSWHQAKKRRQAYLRSQKRAINFDPDDVVMNRRRSRSSNKWWGNRFARV